MEIKNSTINMTKSLLLATGLLLTSSLSVFAQEGCTDPVVPSITGDLSVCVGDDAVLSAAEEADEVRWYSQESDGTLLHTGFDFTIENPLENTSVWAENVNINTDGTNYTGAARLNPGDYIGGAAVSAASSPWGLRFSITKDIVLNSVDVFILAEAPGMMVIQLKNSSYEVLEEIIVTTPAGNNEEPLQHTIDLDFEVPAGTNYSLVASSSPKLVREGQFYHDGFPYPLGDVGLITQGILQDTPGAANAATYYFFYNWDFTVFEDCISDRVAADVTVNEIPEMPVGEEDQVFNDEGETLGDLEVAGENLTWYADSTGEVELETTTELTDETTYYVSQSIENCESDLLAITVHLYVNGVGERDLEKVTVFPVPASDVLYITHHNTVTNIALYNNVGQLVKRISSNGTHESIYVGDLARGMYVIQLNTSTGIVAKRIVLE